MLSIILFLKGNVDNCIRNHLSNSIKELSLTDNHFQLRVKVYFVALSITVLDLRKNVLLQHVEDLFTIFALPFLKNLLFIVFGERLRKFNVVSCSLLAVFFCQNFWFVFKLVNGSLNPSYYTPSPCNFAGIRWHILGSWRISAILLVDLLHFFELKTVTIHNIFKFILELFFDLWTGVNFFKLIKQLKSAKRRIQILTKSVVNQLYSLQFNAINLLLESCETGVPLSLVFLKEYIVLDCLELVNLLHNSFFDLIDLIRTTSNCF